jgi:anti-sigma B factor antagonist
MLKVSAEKRGSIAVLHFEGHLVNGDAIKILRDAVRGQAEACAVVLDLARVDLVDARGLGVLLELREWSQSRGFEFKLVNVTRLVQQVLEITRLDTVFKVSDRDEARSVTAGDQVTTLLETACV